MPNLPDLIGIFKEGGRYVAREWWEKPPLAAGQHTGYEGSSNYPFPLHTGADKYIIVAAATIEALHEILKNMGYRKIP